MKYPLIIILLLISVLAMSQTVKTTYYKKMWSKKVKEKKAKYKKVVTTYDDGFVKTERYDIKKNKIYFIKQMFDNKPVGLWQEYDKKGILISNRNFDSLVYTDIEKMKKDTIKLDTNGFIYASYGTAQKRIDYLRTAIHYPNEAKERGAQGIVYVNFKISKDGDVKNVKILRGVDPFLDYEAYRAVKNMGKWKPATRNGVTVESILNMPIRFILAG